MSFAIVLETEAEEQLGNLDNSVRLRIFKKLKQMEIKDNARHLKKGLPHFVEEVGQYRIAFILRQELNEKRIAFIGTHKEYDKWTHSI